MPFVPADPVASGKPYRVAHVGGHSPSTLADFVGETSFTIHDGGQERLICGIGRTDQDAVRFQEKDASGSSKDVRLWRVGRQPAGDFVAEHAAVF